MSFNSLQSVLPAIGLTQRKIKKLDAICLVREERKNGKQELSYHARPFVVCGIPLRRPPIAQLTHTRRNGKFALDIVGHPRFGLPTVRADCTCSQFGLGMGRDSSSLPPTARSAI